MLYYTRNDALDTFKDDHGFTHNDRETPLLYLVSLCQMIRTRLHVQIQVAYFFFVATITNIR